MRRLLELWNSLLRMILQIGMVVVLLTKDLVAKEQAHNQVDNQVDKQR